MMIGWLLWILSGLSGMAIGLWLARYIAKTVWGRIACVLCFGLLFFGIALCLLARYPDIVGAENRSSHQNIRIGFIDGHILDTDPLPRPQRGLHSLTITADVFRERFNLLMNKRFPDTANQQILPPLVIEQGILGRAFRYHFNNTVMIAGNIRQHDEALDQLVMSISLNTSDTIAVQAAQIAEVIVQTILPGWPRDDIRMGLNILFEQAGIHLDQQVNAFMGELRLTATASPAVGIIFSVSNPTDSFYVPSAEDIWEGE